MERPPPPEKRSLWDFIGKPVVIVLSFILLFAVVFLILAYLNDEPYPYPRSTAPTGALSAEYDNSTDTYRLVLISMSDETLELDEIKFQFLNSYITISHDLPAVLDNENSDITFYDIDLDGKFSEGDEFIINGDIVEPGTVLKIIWNTFGRSICEREFGD
jgi:hypothetical protein